VTDPRIDEQELDRLWNDLAGHKPPSAPYDLPREAADAVRLFHGLATTPPSDAARERVRREVLATIDRLEQERAMEATVAWGVPRPLEVESSSRNRAERVRRRPRKIVGGGAPAIRWLVALALLAITSLGIYRATWEDRSPNGPPNGAVVPAATRACGTSGASASAPSGSPVPVNLRLASPVAATNANVSFVWSTTDAQTEGHTIGNLAIDPQCRLWAVDVTGNRFLIFDLAGKLLETWGSGGRGDGQFDFANNGYYGGVAFAPDGGFYVVDVGNSRVQQFAADRSFVRAWKITDDAGATVSPYWIAYGPDGNVYVSTNANSGLIQVFSSDGRLLRRFGSRFPGDDALGPIAFDPDGNPWVSVPGEPSIVEFSATGDRTAKIDLTGKVSQYPFGLAIDASGRFYVVDGSGGKVSVFDAAGALLFSWGEYGRDVGQLNNPWWISLDDSGGVYVAEQGHPRVQRFQVQP
jgi:hypothetical protein